MKNKEPVQVKAAPVVVRTSAETEKAVAVELLYNGEVENLEELFEKGKKIDAGTDSRDDNQGS